MAKRAPYLKSLGKMKNDLVLDSFPFSIGRCRTANLIVPDVNISRNHCQIKLGTMNIWFVEDFSSSGTFVNEKLVGKSNYVELKSDDVIRLGPKECNLVWEFKTDMAEDIREANRIQTHLGKLDALMSEKNEIQKPEEIEKMNNAVEVKLCNMQEKIDANVKIEQLKSQIHILQEKIVLEKMKWENRFVQEKKQFEEKINEHEEKLIAQQQKVREISDTYHIDLECKLKKQEEEKETLLMKLREMEEYRDALHRKLHESDEIHLLDKIRLEEQLQKELLEKEQLEEKINTLKNVNVQIENNLKEKELQEVKVLKDEISKVKCNILDNITEVMETELQCSICSELFVSAITLNCTHTFCKYCIDRWKKKKKNCPICRKSITSENRSIAVDNYIHKMVENLSEEYRSRRQNIIAERTPGITKKKCKPSGKIDLRSAAQQRQRNPN